MPVGFTGTMLNSGSQCGACRWKPAFLQRCNNMMCFVAFYAMLLLIYGMANAYSSSVIQSMERRFGFSSKLIGLILSVNDISQIVVALLTAYFGGSGHRPRLIMIGGLLLGIAVMLHAAPEVLFPSRRTIGRSKTAETVVPEKLCRDGSDNIYNNSYSVSNRSAEFAHSDGESINLGGPVAVFIVAQLIQGVGSTMVMILALPFIDDSVDKKNSSVYFAISLSARIFGPVLGFLLGALCNSIYLDWSNPGFNQTDPRWISAWYLGFLWTGASMCLVAALIGCFPAFVPARSGKAQTNGLKHSGPNDAGKAPVSSQPFWKDLPRNVRRLVCNGTYMLRVGTNILDGFCISGYFSFLPKFLGQQFHISQSGASIAGGVPGILATGVGVVLGGLLIRRCSLQPRQVGALLATSAFIIGGALLVMIALGCPDAVVMDPAGRSNVEYENQAECGAMENSCRCQPDDYDPICDTARQMTYYSPCHAGCQSVIHHNNTKPLYQKCMCVENSKQFATNSTTPPLLTKGHCYVSCQNLYYFVTILAIAKFIAGLPVSGGIMIQFRVVDPDLKTLSHGLSALLTAAFGSLPAPVLVGTVIDSTCLLWQLDVNGNRGSCRLYNIDGLRWKFHLFIGLMKIAAAFLELMVTWRVWNLTFERKKENPPEVSSATTASSVSVPSTVQNLQIDNGREAVGTAQNSRRVCP
ncbi:solute carrier organic anion transporter family member 74D-like [Paramacrobiotus metropolitanus]|uniref:solute carrier organic anion transporter family member 74D-like n=1 Tax=Paramacrobiotus metropolitanus TaxID=2943436 RepID=UPI002445D56F|nr:solute carrier organic anion transporter family member 74D-like [Paramacrobiotus metropolitanus]